MILNNLNLYLVLIFLVLFNEALCAQNATKDSEKTNFDKDEAFSPLLMNDQSNSFHSATGNPGSDYWQNKADYIIEAELDTVNHSVTGKLKLIYTNNSPYELENIWFHLDQNTFKKDSRGSIINNQNGENSYAEGYEIANVHSKDTMLEYTITDTRMQVHLPVSLKGNGEDITIELDYSYRIPVHGRNRTGRIKTVNGTIYTIAQWYPRVAVYDEVEGWNTLPYLGAGEFYLEYGDFDYTITAPENMLVAGSGVLANSKEVLTKIEHDRLENARKSDSVITIFSKEEMLKGTAFKKGKGGKKTWHFKMKNSRDISWAASTAFIWDAARINLPDEKTGLAQSFYPAENSGEDGFGRATEYAKGAIEIYSKQWFPYPYEVATTVAGQELGMEYPGLVFCGFKNDMKNVWGCINHEFGHIWFPMIVGSNERKYGWLDEGLNNFMNNLAHKKFNDGEFYQKTNLQEQGNNLFSPNQAPVFTRPDAATSEEFGQIVYNKPSVALGILRDYVLGEERFDRAFKAYIERWKYKHPQPWDFFNTMSNVSGEDLSWFFKAWFVNNWENDQAVTEFSYKDEDPEKGVEITFLNKGKMAMPLEFEVVYEDGETEHIRLPVEIWMKGSEFKYYLDSTKKIESVEVDPKHQLPDIDISNNKLKADS